jgi:hypothetical protein
MEQDRMKTKLYTSMMIALLVAGLALSIPVASVQAWGWRSVTKTPFTVNLDLSGMRAFSVPMVKQIGDCVLEKNEFIWENVASDERANGFNFNTVYWLWTGEPMIDGYMWGKRVIRNGPDSCDTIIGHGYYAYAWVKDGIFTWKAIDFINGYKVVTWSSGLMLAPTPIQGVII